MFQTLTARRHGDVFLKPVESFPTGIQQLDTNILAFGEATGHDHRVVNGQATVYAAKGETEAKYVKVTEDSELVHQEHETIDVPTGSYEIVHEREYSPFEEEIKRVQD